MIQREKRVYIINNVHLKESADSAFSSVIEMIRFSFCYQKKAFILAEILYKSLKILLCLTWYWS